MSESSSGCDPCSASFLPLRAVGALLSPMVSGWAGIQVGGRREKVCSGCTSETVRCRKLILGRDIGFGL